MSEQKTRDKIDFELSRTYFGSAEKKIPAEPQKKTENDKTQKVPVPRRRSSPVLRILFVLWIISICIFVAGYFLRENRIIFSFSINIEPHTGPKKLSQLAKIKQVLTDRINQNSSSETIKAALPETKKALLDKIKQPSSSKMILVSLPKTLEELSAKTKQEESPKTIQAILPRGIKSLLEVKKESPPKTSPTIGVVKKQKRVYTKPGLPKAKTLYNFEKNEQGWEIPLWELDKPDHVAISLKTTKAVANEGNSSLELNAEFPGGNWSGALVEVQQYLNLEDYDNIQADIYVPESCPEGLRCKLILTVGDNWRFVESSRSVRLVPGKWTTLNISIAEGSTDWRRMTVDRAFKEDVRKVALRVESNRKPVYSGPIYFDNIRVTSGKKL